MSDRPTPETDALFRTFADGEAAPSHAEYYGMMRHLERERDEAREEIAKLHDVIRSEWPEDQAEELIKQCKQ